MSILIDQNTAMIVQGITGKEGGRAAQEMAAYGSLVLAGVTPGKGGQTSAGGLPVFDSVREARECFPEISMSLVAVPAPFVFDAVAEALYYGIKLINILAEKVPVSATVKMIALARFYKAIIIGPSSVGIISPGKAKLGSIGSSGMARTVFSPGPVGVISKSGGMTSEISKVLTDAGWGQSTALGIGGDILVCSDFVDVASQFEQDKETKAIVIFGEIGGTYEEKLADAMQNKTITKPVVALIAGQFADYLPPDTVLGHAGAIVSQGRGSAVSKINALRQAGALIAETPEDIPVLLTKVL